MHGGKSIQLLQEYQPQRNEKNTIMSLDGTKITNFIMAINPCSYKFNNGDSGRTHYGMISQDIEDEMNALGMTSQDFAGFIKSPKTKEVMTKDAEGNEIRTDEVIENEYVYGLRYEEFISPLIKTVQCIKIEKDAEIIYLQQQINDLKAKIG